MLKPGDFLQNRYEILEQIGCGGMSYVYRAHCHTLNRQVAIKVLREEFARDEAFVAKFKMEAQAAALLSHPNIVNVYDVVDEEKLHYIVMELIEGITLKQYIERKGRLEQREAVGIALQVAQGIAAAHEKNIIHRDIKPQNMIIARDGTVKVADFGIARAISAQTKNLAVGSVHYISPEQAKGELCDARSDIYSFGITLYEMVTGEVPFDGDNTVSVAIAHLEEPIPDPRNFAPELGFAVDQIVRRCTKKKPGERYQSMNEVIADLRRALVEPDCDLYGEEEAANEEPEDLTQTRAINSQEMAKIKENARREKPKRTHISHKRPQASEESTDEVEAQFDRIITVIGIFAAVLVVAVVIFVFTRLGGIFNWRTDQNNTDAVVTTEYATQQTTQEVTITNNETEVPKLLGMTLEEAEAALEKGGLVLARSGESYSENYEEGQIMAQSYAEGEVLKKGTAVGVTVSLGTDQVDLSALGLVGVTGEVASNLLDEAGIIPNVSREYSDSVDAGIVIRYEPQQAKVGDTVTIYVSLGKKAVQGQVPKLVGESRESAVAQLKAAGLVPGTVTTETNELAAGTVISQAEMEGVMLPVGSAVDFSVSLGPDQTQETTTEAQAAATESYYLSSIDTSCDLSSYIGPATNTSSVRVAVRLKQQVNNEVKYTTLIEARTVSGAQIIPISISRIRGAWGVDNGEVQVVDVGKNPPTVIASYPVSFFPAE